MARTDLNVTAELAALNDLRTKPSGTIRITAHDHSFKTLLWPALEKLLPQHPDIKVEVGIEHGLTDIVAERYDADLRLGETIAQDMVAVRIGPDLRSAVVGAPCWPANALDLQAWFRKVAHRQDQLRVLGD